MMGFLGNAWEEKVRKNKMGRHSNNHEPSINSRDWMPESDQYRNSPRGRKRFDDIR